MYKLLIFATFVGTSVVAVTWKDCGKTGSCIYNSLGSQFGVIKDVIIPSCPGEKECPLKRGTEVTFQIDFTSKEVAPVVTAVVHGIIGSIPIPFPVPEPDACKNCGLVCPLKSGTSYAYKTTIIVRPQYPTVNVIVKWELKDKNAKDLVCIEVPAKIV